MSKEMWHTQTRAQIMGYHSVLKKHSASFYVDGLDSLYEQNKLSCVSHDGSGLLIGAAGPFPNIQWCCYDVEGHHYEVL